MSDLKPCPMCGSPASVMKTVFGWFAECNKNGHIHNVGTFGGTFQETKEAAIEDWNRRVKNGWPDQQEQTDRICE